MSKKIVLITIRALPSSIGESPTSPRFIRMYELPHIIESKKRYNHLFSGILIIAIQSWEKRMGKWHFLLHLIKTYYYENPYFLRFDAPNCWL